MIIGDFVPHPDDEWIEVTMYGQPEPVYILGRSGTDKAIALSRTRYLRGHITLEQFAAEVDRIAPSTRSP